MPKMTKALGFFPGGDVGRINGLPAALNRLALLGPLGHLAYPADLDSDGDGRRQAQVPPWPSLAGMN
jgi:hypothetical protein